MTYDRPLQTQTRTLLHCDVSSRAELSSAAAAVAARHHRIQGAHAYMQRCVSHHAVCGVLPGSRRLRTTNAMNSQIFDRGLFCGVSIELHNNLLSFPLSRTIGAMQLKLKIMLLSVDTKSAF